MNASRGSCVRVVLTLLLSAFAREASAQTVHWLDPLTYAKPRAVTLSKPDESKVSNKYWVDLTAGSGTTCSQQAPCKSLDDVLGKPGTSGGPAIIYVKGRGHVSLFNDTLHGTGDADCRTGDCTGWILIRPWPAGSPGCATECTATIDGNSNINSANVHHVMFDGGPDLKIRFESDAAGQYGFHVIADWITIHRTETVCVGAGKKQLAWSVGDSPIAKHVAFINDEFHGCAATGDQSSAVYVGPGPSGGYSDFVFQSNIVREFFGEGLEINPRVTSSGATIVGNAFHDVGKGTCATSWKCRPAITVGVQSGNGNDATVIAENLVWDVGSGCIWDRGGGSPAALIVNNTCFDYGKGGASEPNPQGISGYTNGGGATVRNNIIYAPNGIDPFDGSPFVASNNLCAAGKSCGQNRQDWTATTVLSTTPSDATFLQIGASSAAVDKGMPVSVVTTYVGGTRPVGAGFDIGAFELGVDPTGGADAGSVPADAGGDAASPPSGDGGSTDGGGGEVSSSAGCSCHAAGGSNDRPLGSIALVFLASMWWRRRHAGRSNAITSVSWSMQYPRRS